MTHVLEIVHGTEDNGLEGDQDEIFRQQRAQVRLSQNVLHETYFVLFCAVSSFYSTTGTWGTSMCELFANLG
jgi:hypothetical protein